MVPALKIFLMSLLGEKLMFLNIYMFSGCFSFNYFLYTYLLVFPFSVQWFFVCSIFWLINEVVCLKGFGLLAFNWGFSFQPACFYFFTCLPYRAIAFFVSLLRDLTDFSPRLRLVHDRKGLHCKSSFAQRLHLQLST